MNLKTTIARLKSILAALEYSSGQPVFTAATSIRVSTGMSPSVRRPPECLIRITGSRGYGMHGNKLKVVTIELDCAVNVRGPDGEYGVIDGNRATDATQGAGIESMMAKVLPAVRLIDTDSVGSHTTWTRTVDPGSPVADENLTRQIVTLESLCEVA